VKCHDKMVFSSKEAAERRAHVWSQAVYQCPDCRLFHLTKKAQSLEDIPRASHAADVSRAHALGKHDAKGKALRLRLKKRRRP